MAIWELLLMIALGWALRRAIRTDSPFRVVREVNDYIFFPLLIFCSIASKDWGFLSSLWIAVVAAVLVVFICLTVAHFYASHVHEVRWARTLVILSFYSNSVALGYPMASVFVDDITPAIVFAQTAFFISLPLAVFIGARYAHGDAGVLKSVLTALRFPPVMATLAAVVLVVAGISLPHLDTGLSIGRVGLYLILIYFGSRVEFGRVNPRHIAEVGALRMALPLAVVLPLLRGTPWEIFAPVVVEAVMPPAIYANIVISRYGLSDVEAMSTTFVLSIAVIVLIAALSMLA